MSLSGDVAKKGAALSKWLMKKGKKGVDVAKEAAGKAGEKLAEGAGEAYSALKKSEGVNTASKYVTGNAIAAKKGAEGIIKKHPKKAVAAAAAAGYAASGDSDEDKKKKKKRPYLED